MMRNIQDFMIGSSVWFCTGSGELKLAVKMSGVISHFAA
jgi:hypothetical protein